MPSRTVRQVSEFSSGSRKADWRSWRRGRSTVETCLGGPRWSRFDDSESFGRRKTDIGTKYSMSKAPVACPTVRCLSTSLRGSPPSVLQPDRPTVHPPLAPLASAFTRSVLPRAPRPSSVPSSFRPSDHLGTSASLRLCARTSDRLSELYARRAGSRPSDRPAVRPSDRPTVHPAAKGVEP